MFTHATKYYQVISVLRMSRNQVGILHTQFFILYLYHLLSGKTQHADVSAPTDMKEPGTPTTTEPSSALDDQSTPESQNLSSEKSDGEHDLSAMEVE